MFSFSGHSFLTALILVFIAEMGDKTQLVALSFATRFPALLVLAAITIATLLVHLFSTLIGQVAGESLPTFWVNLVAGLAFIGFGIWSLKGDKLDGESKLKKELAPFLTVAITFFIAELGDKTMLATITVASQEKNFLAVWLGSTVGMVLADGVALCAGQILKETLSETLIKYVAAAVFICCGLFTLYSLYAKPVVP
jgi:Ca2+/H+ antiporter, TMEM165/GDT1 family